MAGIIDREVAEAAREIGTDTFLVEEMVTGAVAELLVGVTRDPAHGFVLTVAAGGVMTEVLHDSASLLVPARETDVKQALNSLNCAVLLSGYRGNPSADLQAIVAAVMTLQDYVVAHADRLEEVEINPLICTPNAAIAADALIRTVLEE